MVAILSCGYLSDSVSGRIETDCAECSYFLPTYRYQRHSIPILVDMGVTIGF